MADKDVALGFLQASIALAGLLLVFIGFLLERASRTDLKSARLKVKVMAIAGLVPFTATLICSLQSIWAIQGAHGSSMYLFCTMKIVLALTAVYAMMATFYEVE
jgi:hypothetical protein